MLTLETITIIGVWLVMGWMLIQQQNERIKMAKTVEELAQAIRDANTQVGKGIGEVLTKIRNLEALIANGADLSAIETAIGELKTSAQTLDDIVTDIPPPAPEA